jgi:Ca2+-binding RTX toxin-like protein
MKINRTSTPRPTSTAKAPAKSPKKSAAARRDAGDRFEPGQKGKVIHSNAKVIRGTPGDDIIYGGGADQKILGGGGNDIIIGGGGNDRIYGGKGRDKIRGGEGGDSLYGGDGHDTMTGGRGNDRLVGGRGNDKLAGELGDDHLFGGEGHDRATGGMGIDVLRGGKGDDLQSGDAGPDFVDGGQGNDTVSYATQAGPGYNPKKPNSGVKVLGNTPSRWESTFEGVHYPGSSYAGNRAQGGGGVDGLKSNENVIGSGKDDFIQGNFKTVDGGPGNDVAVGKIGKKISASGEADPPVNTRGAVVQVSRSPLSGATTINVTGGKGNDRITVERKGQWVTVTNSAGLASQGAGKVHGNTVRFKVKGPTDAVQIDGGEGNDRLQVKGMPTRVPVTLSGGNGNDKLYGGKGNDLLNDGAGNDKLYGGGGSDGLTNSQGRDRLFGGAGADLLVSSSLDQGDFVDGGKGRDNVSFAQVGHEFAVRAQIGGTARRIDASGKVFGPTLRIAGSADDLEGTEGDDVLIGDAKENHLLGRGGKDRLIGRGGNDLLEARDGAEDKQVSGGKGRDKATMDKSDRRVLAGVEDAVAR